MIMIKFKIPLLVVYVVVFDPAAGSPLVSFVMTSTNTCNNCLQAIKYGQQIRSDLELLKTEYLKVKDENNRLKVEATDLRSQVEESNRERDQMEENSTRMFQEWNDILNKEKEKIADMQKQMVPARDMEMLRIQMLEELQAPHEQRVDELLHELDKYREIYNKEHRQIELLRNVFEQNEAHYKKLLHEMQEKHQADMEEFLGKNRKLQDLVEEMTNKDKTREQEKTIADLLIKERRLNEEVDTLRREKQDMELVKERDHLLTVETLKKQEGAYLLLQKEKESVLTRYVDLKEQYEEIKLTLAETRETVSVLEQQKVNLEDKLSSVSREFRYFKETASQRVDELKLTTGKRITELQTSNEQLTAETMRISAEKAGLAEKLAHYDKEAATQVRVVQEQEAKKQFELQKTVAELHTQVAELTAATLGQEDMQRKTSDAFKKDLQVLKEDMAAMEDDKVKSLASLEKLQQTLSTALADKDVLSRELRELQEEYEDLQKQHRELRLQQHRIVAEKDKAYGEKELDERELLSLTREMETERNEKMRLIADMQEAWTKERLAVQDHMKKIQADSMKQLATAWDKVKVIGKEKDRYKKMCRMLKKRSADAQFECVQIKRESHLLVQSKEMEISSAKSAQSHAEREMDEMRIRMNSGLMIGNYSTGKTAPVASATSTAAACAVAASTSSSLRQSHSFLSSAKAAADAATASSAAFFPVASSLPSSSSSVSRNRTALGSSTSAGLDISTGSPGALTSDEDPMESLIETQKRSLMRGQAELNEDEKLQALRDKLKQHQ